MMAGDRLLLVAARHRRRRHLRPDDDHRPATSRCTSRSRRRSSSSPSWPVRAAPCISLNGAPRGRQRAPRAAHRCWCHPGRAGRRAAVAASARANSSRGCSCSRSCSSVRAPAPAPGVIGLSATPALELLRIAQGVPQPRARELQRRLLPHPPPHRPQPRRDAQLDVGRRDRRKQVADRLDRQRRHRLAARPSARLRDPSTRTAPPA